MTNITHSSLPAWFWVLYHRNDYQLDQLATALAPLLRHPDNDEYLNLHIDCLLDNAIESSFLQTNSCHDIAIILLPNQQMNDAWKLLLNILS